MSVQADVVDSSNNEYAKVLEDFKKEILKAESDQENVKKIYDEFCQKYMMPKSIWSQRLKLYSFNSNEAIIIYKEGMNQFYYDQSYNHLRDCIRKICINHFSSSPFKENVQHLSKDEIKLFLTFPHYRLKECFMLYEETKNSQVPHKFVNEIKKMEQISEKLKKAAENNIYDWFESLKEVNDFEFVRHNIEYQLGQNLDNKKLWKIYINFLKNVDPKEMLQIYSKYCRYFLDDSIMKEKYETEVKKHGPVYVQWKNPFGFENVTKNSVSNYIENDLKPIISNISERLEQKTNKNVVDLQQFFGNFNKIHFYQNQRNQQWAIPSVFIKYIMDNAKPLLYAKLQQTCKYFYNKQKLKLFCYKLEENEEENFKNTQFKGQSFIFKSMDSFKIFEIQKIVLMTSIKFKNSNDNFYLSKIITKYIYKCDLKYIDIWNQILNENELKFLIDSGSVESFKIRNTQLIEEQNGNSIILENILKMLPKIRFFDITLYYFAPIITLRTLNYLSKLKFDNKIYHFHITQITSPLDADDFCSFIKKNAAPYSNFYINFENPSFMETLNINADEMLKQWKPYDEKPSFSFPKRRIPR